MTGMGTIEFGWMVLGALQTLGGTLPGIEFWRTITIIAAAIGQTAFTLLYLSFPWWRNFLGRALFFKASAFCLLLDVAVLGRMLDWPHEDATFVTLYGLTAAGIWYQFCAFLRVRLAGREDAVSGNPKAVAAEREAHGRDLPPTHKAWR